MLFNSWQFGIFFIVVTMAYFLLPNRHRWFLLLAASCYFYMAFVPIYILILLFTIVVDYFAGILIENSQGTKRKLYLVMSSVANIGVLAFFKYFNFLNDNFASLTKAFGLNYPIADLSILLPIGLSFHTFQSLSYTIEVYRGQVKAERHIGIFALYVMFYPQLVAGPIERGTHLLPQLKTLTAPDHSHRISFDYERVVSGLRLMLLGFFKKMVLADNFAQIVRPVYENPNEFSGMSALVATVAFAFQIFFDFSAYTDIARGASRILGFELMENFRCPYFAVSIQDFWQRWHISLSSWFRDYLYIPLGGNRVSKWRWFVNLWIVFLLCGLWHGAHWTFLIWGALHGFYYFMTKTLARPVRWLIRYSFLSQFTGLCRWIFAGITFLLVCFAWVMFRAESLSKALVIWANLARIPGEMLQYLFLVLTDDVPFAPFKAFGLSWLIKPLDRISFMPVYVFALTAGYLFVSCRMRREGDVMAVFASWGAGTRWAAYFFALACILLLGCLGMTQFIYFQF